MTRSFAYAAARHAAESRPAAAPQMTELAEFWRRRATDGFRAAYRKSMRPSYPSSQKHLRELISFCSVERAVHALSHELTNRPGWAATPLQGILGVLEQAAGGDGLIDD